MRSAEKDSSPRSTGPAGGQFETKVGTHYVLALLANTESLGLPGAVVDRLEFQRGGQGHPLDDVIERVWTRGLMVYAAAYARYWSAEMLQELVIEVLKAFSDEAFIDATAAFIVQSDLHYIEGDAEDRTYLLSVREAFWPRLKATWHWQIGRAHV